MTEGIASKTTYANCKTVKFEAEIEDMRGVFSTGKGTSGSDNDITILMQSENKKDALKIIEDLEKAIEKNNRSIYRGVSYSIHYIVRQD